MWEGETAFIVGGGPSLLDVDISVLEGKRVIGVNNAYQLLPNAPFLVFHDHR